ncbi:MAG: DUF2953 domain-containing protein [Atribacterota bacterium]|nr:DUF2953 domain-containing protein [Atribacterota bacterium]
MEFVLYLLLYLFLILLILIAAIIFIPVVYSVEGEKEEYYFLLMRISWLFSLINLIAIKEDSKKIEFFLKIFGFRINLIDFRKVQKQQKKKEIKKVEQKKQTTKKPLNRYFNFFQQSFMSQTLRLIRRIFRHIKPKVNRLYLIYGFEDPADTGILTGIFYLLFPNSSYSNIIKMQPVFVEEIIEGEIIIKGRIIIAFLLCYFIQFYFAKGVRQTIREIRNK